MSEQLPTLPPDAAEMQAKLQEVAQLMRKTRHLDSPSKQCLADLLEELGQAILATSSPSAEMLHVAQSAAQLAQKLHKKEEEGILAGAKDHLQQAIAHAEVEAPLISEIARRLVDALSNIGI